jgi:hypothetical protein
MKANRLQAAANKSNQLLNQNINNDVSNNPLLTTAIITSAGRTPPIGGTTRGVLA